MPHSTSERLRIIIRINRSKIIRIDHYQVLLLLSIFQEMVNWSKKWHFLCILEFVERYGKYCILTTISKSQLLSFGEYLPSNHSIRIRAEARDDSEWKVKQYFGYYKLLIIRWNRATTDKIMASDRNSDQNSLIWKNIGDSLSFISLSDCVQKFLKFRYLKQCMNVVKYCNGHYNNKWHRRWEHIWGCWILFRWQCVSTIHYNTTFNHWIKNAWSFNIFFYCNKLRYIHMLEFGSLNEKRRMK